MVGIAILMMACGAIGLRLHTAIEKKRFTSGLDKLKARLIDTRLIAANMQSDWKGILQLKNGEWIFESYCLDESKFHARSLPLGAFSLFLNQEKKESLEFLFAASGQVRMEKDFEGVLFFSKKAYDATWKFPEIFLLDESKDGKKIGSPVPRWSLNYFFLVMLTESTG